MWVSLEDRSAKSDEAAEGHAKENSKSLSLGSASEYYVVFLRRVNE